MSAGQRKAVRVREKSCDAQDGQAAQHGPGQARRRIFDKPHIVKVHWPRKLVGDVSSAYILKYFVVKKPQKQQSHKGLLQPDITTRLRKAHGEHGRVAVVKRPEQ